MDRKVIALIVAVVGGMFVGAPILREASAQVSAGPVNEGGSVGAKGYQASGATATCADGYCFQNDQVGIVRSAADELGFLSGSTPSLFWKMTSAGALIPGSGDGTGSLGNTTTRVGNIFVNDIRATSSSTVPLISRGASGQTANLFEANVNGGAAVASVSASGIGTLNGGLNVGGSAGIVAGANYVAGSGSAIIVNGAGASGIVDLRSNNIIFFRLGADGSISNLNGSDPVLLNDAHGTCVGNGTGTDCDGALSAGSLTVGGAALASRTKYLQTDIDIPLATTACTTADATGVTCSLGDECRVAPLQDDAAWDTGTLDCFCEGANDAKIVYCPGGTAGSGNPAATNDYNVFISPQ